MRNSICCNGAAAQVPKGNEIRQRCNVFVQLPPILLRPSQLREQMICSSLFGSLPHVTWKSFRRRDPLDLACMEVRP